MQPANVVLGLTGVFLFATVGHAQSPAKLEATAPKPAFDVASVRPTAAQAFTGLKTDPGRLMASGASLSDLIRQAYGVSELQVSGAPTALGRFDIEAKVEGSHTRRELLQMLQTLLADRFKLALHREIREMQVEVLEVVSRSALKPGRVPPTESGPVITTRTNRSAGTVNSVAVLGQNVTLPDVANFLSGRLGRIVVDKTGLTGAFDFSQEVAVDQNEIKDPNVSERDATAHLFADFVQRLGLKLESQKTPVEILMVDHAVKPDVD